MDANWLFRKMQEGTPSSWRGINRRWLSALALLALLISGTIIVVQAQAQTCRDISNITVCGDTMAESATANGGGFRLRGNVRIGAKGSPAQVIVRDIGSVFDGTILDPSISTATYFHFNQPDPNTGTTDFLIGDVGMINDPTGLTLMGTSAVPNLSTPENDVFIGRLFVDPVNQKIFNPAAGAVPVFNQNNVTRNANIRLSFISRVGALAFYESGGSVTELAGVNAEFNLATKKFTSVLPIKLKVGDAASNPNLQINIRAEFNETAAFNGTVDGFKLSLGGLLMDASGIVIKPAQGANPVEFTAAAVKVLKSDNPNVPNLDPTDPTLIFAFTNLKYKSGNWEIGGVEVPIKEWEFGPAFKMTNQTIGIINEANSQSFQIKSTMQFGAGSDASKLPITMKIGRALAGDGSVKPIFSAGLQNIKPKLGTFTFNLTGVAFVGDAGQDFFGIQATTAAVQWPAHLGGQTAAALNGFKLGMNNNRKLKFALDSTTFGLPPFENKVFKGTLQATIGVVSETLTITGTGTFALNLPGNANSAGVAVNAIMRYNKDVDASLPATLSANQIAAQLTASGLDATRICFGPGQVRVTCPGDPPPPVSTAPKAFELRLAGFNIKLAGFGLNVLNPRSTDDGGFAADNVGFTLPLGLQSDGNSTNGAQIQGLVVSGDGDVSISGGGLGLPTLKIGKFQLAGLRGSFLKEPNGNFAFTGAARFPLPGIDAIGVEVTIRTNPSGDFGGAGIKIEINLPTTAGIPVGPSGMLLTGMRGQFDINNGAITVAVGVTFRSVATIPLGALGQLSVVKIDGDITVNLDPFKLIGNAELSVLIFKVASASIRFGDGEGFDGRSGLNVEVNVNQVIMKGIFKMRYSKGTASDPNKRRFAAAATWQLGIVKGQFGTGRPPFNLGGIQAQLSGGIFTDNNNNPATETTGIRASICGPNGNLCIGTFVNLGEEVGSGDFIDFTNIDKYALIPAAAIRAAAARGEVGFASRRLTMDEVDALGLVVAADALQAGIYEEIVDIPVTQTTTLLAGIDYFSGTPLVRLKLPNGTILTEATVNQTTQTVLTDTQSITKSIYFVISGAPVGTYQLLIDNASDYEKISYTVNESPKLTIGNAQCLISRPQTAVTTLCLNNVIASEGEYLAPIQVEASQVDPNQGAEINASTATITWTGSDIDSPGATVDIGYVKDSGDQNDVDYEAINLVVEDLPLSAGSHTFDFKESGSGKYRFVVIADDGVNGLVYLASAAVLSVTDKLAPAVPTGLAAVPQAGEMQIKWTQNTEADLAGYELGFGLVNDPAQFIYTRNVGPKEIMTGTNNIVDAKLWGLQDNTTIFYGLRAYDSTGNFSEWAPLQSAQPWALGPKAWEPVPNGVGVKGVVEIAFAVPMKFETLASKLVVKDGNGQVVLGTPYFLSDLDGNVIGVGFQPATAFNGPASASLVGGADGVQAADGRTMGGNYSWSFTLTTPNPLPPLETAVYLPFVSK